MLVLVLGAQPEANECSEVEIRAIPLVQQEYSEEQTGGLGAQVPLPH